MAASGGQALPPPAPLPLRQRRGARVRPVATTTSDAQHARFPRRATRSPHWLDLVPQAFGLTLGHALREDVGGARLDRPAETAPAPARAPGPGAIAAPGGAVAGLLRLDLPPREGTRGEAVARGLTAPPAGAGAGTAPQAGGVGIEAEARAATGLIRERRPGDRGVRAGRGLRRSPTGRPAGAARLFFTAPRPRSGPSWLPLGEAHTGARSRPLHGEERAPCGRGSCSTRRARGFGSASGIGGGRPGRGRSDKPRGPWAAKRCPQGRTAAWATWQVAETAEPCGPAPLWSA